MASLPDDIWHKILQIGIKTNRLDHTDLCSLAIVNHHFDKLTQDPVQWDKLILRDYPFPFYDFLRSPSKDLYRKERKKRWSHFVSSLTRRLEESLASLRDWPFWVPNNRNDRLSRYQSRIHDLQLQRTSNSRTLQLQSSFSHSATQVSSGNQTNTANVDTVGGFGDVSSFFEGDSANQPILTKAKRQYYEKKTKRFDKSSRSKVIPSSKSYIPMNRPPRRSMPRKI